MSERDNCEKGVIIRREFQSINDFILWNWRAWVDTIFWHVFGKLRELGSPGEKVMTGWQRSCRWVMMPMIKQQGMIKSRDNGWSMPMADINGCRLLGILNVITKSRLSFLIMITRQKCRTYPSCHLSHVVIPSMTWETRYWNMQLLFGMNNKWDLQAHRLIPM